jgi:hypothetical protein
VKSAAALVPETMKSGGAPAAPVPVVGGLDGGGGAGFFFAGDFLVTAFFAGDFFIADFVAGDFLAVDFLRVDFFVDDFFAGDMAEDLKVHTKFKCFPHSGL